MTTEFGKDNRDASEIISDQIRFELNSLYDQLAEIGVAIPLLNFDSSRPRKFINEVIEIIEAVDNYFTHPQENEMIAKKFANKRLLWLWQDTMLKKGLLKPGEKHDLENYKTNRAYKAISKDKDLRKSLQALRDMGNYYIEARKIASSHIPQRSY